MLTNSEGYGKIVFEELNKLISLVNYLEYGKNLVPFLLDKNKCTENDDFCGKVLEGIF